MTRQGETTGFVPPAAGEGQVQSDHALYRKLRQKLNRVHLSNQTGDCPLQIKLTYGEIARLSTTLLAASPEQPASEAVRSREIAAMIEELDRFRRPNERDLSTGDPITPLPGFNPRYLLGQALLYREWCHSDLWGDPSSAELAARIAETAYHRIRELEALAHPAESAVVDDRDRLVSVVKEALRDDYTDSGMEDAFFRWPIIERALREAHHAESANRPADPVQEARREWAATVEGDSDNPLRVAEANAILNGDRDAKYGIESANCPVGGEALREAIFERDDECNIEFGTVPDCDCPHEHWHVNGVCLDVHIEEDGSGHIILTLEDDPIELQISGVANIDEARTIAFAWAPKRLGLALPPAGAGDMGYARGVEGAGAWQPIETAPKDGRRFLALHRSPHRGESRIETVWWQPEFEAFISRCHEMTMAPGYLIDGETRKLHSPDIFPATHWLCVIPEPPALPARKDAAIEGGER